jgi:hypothetical protein
MDQPIIQPRTEPLPETPVQPAKPNRLPLFVGGLIVVVVLALGVAGALLLRQHASPVSDEASRLGTTPTVTPTATRSAQPTSVDMDTDLDQAETQLDGVDAALKDVDGSLDDPAPDLEY